MGAELFTYTLDFTTTYRGQDMLTTTGTFCNHYTSLTVSGSPTRIRLRKNRPIIVDLTIGTLVVPNDGQTHVACFNNVKDEPTYHFDYTTDGPRVQAMGKVFDQ
nr:604_t:CDS:1 [Entrophospora candida]